MKTELKPCPFCGGKAKWDKDWQAVVCTNCGASTRHSILLVTKKKKDVIEAWNNRHSPWHTGIPTEEGYYLVHLEGYYNQDTVGYIVAIWKNGGWRNINKGSCYNLGGVEAWQRIEPFKEDTE